MDQQEARTAHFAGRERSVAEVVAFNAGWDALEAEFEERVRLAQEQAWNEGYATGKSRAMRYMSDEPGLGDWGTNPYTQGDKQA